MVGRSAPVIVSQSFSDHTHAPPAENKHNMQFQIIDITTFEKDLGFVLKINYSLLIFMFIFRCGTFENI